MKRVDDAVHPSAGRSTGPKTPEGKARSARNALKHGLRARKYVLCDESPEEFREYRAALMQELAPLGSLETFHANRIAQATWRLNRCMTAEAQMFDHERSLTAGPMLNLGQMFSQPQFHGPRGVALLIRYETALQRLLEASTRELRRLQHERREQESLLLDGEDLSSGPRASFRDLPSRESDPESIPVQAQPGNRIIEDPSGGPEEPSATPGREKNHLSDQYIMETGRQISKRTPPPPPGGENRLLATPHEVQSGAETGNFFGESA